MERVAQIHLYTGIPSAEIEQTLSTLSWLKFLSLSLQSIIIDKALGGLERLHLTDLLLPLLSALQPHLLEVFLEDLL